MSKARMILSNDNIRDIFQFHYEVRTEIEENLSDDYFLKIDDKDVSFMNKEKWLNNCTTQLKMKLFHMTLQSISTMMFETYIEKKEITISDKVYTMIYPYHSIIKTKAFYKEIKEKIRQCNFIEIKKSIQELYVDLVSLVSRKSSGTEFTPLSIVQFMFDSMEYQGDTIKSKRLLEPACGSGIYLSEAIKRLLSTNKMSLNEIFEVIVNRQAITGFDINPINVFSTKLILTLEVIDYLNSIDEIDLVELLNKLPIYCRNALQLDDGNFDFVIGNPPYIRLQNLSLEERDYIKSNFESATGRFDTYVCFIEKSIKMLKPRGKLSLITSNKYFTTNYGKGIRGYIAGNFELELILDMHDTKFFEASVLPAIITGHRKDKPSNKLIAYFHIKQDNANNKIYKEENIFDVILSTRMSNEYQKDYYKINNGRFDMLVEFVHSNEQLPKNGKQWNFGSQEDIEIKAYIENQNVELLGSIAEVCVGIKTTADDVFVKPMTHEFVVRKDFENEVIYPLIQSQNVERWKIQWSTENNKDRYILYPHEDINSKMVATDLDKYPNVKKYIYDNEMRLKQRTYLMESNTRKWYECWVPQHLSKFKQPKIVTSDIVSSNSFALDLEGRLCQGNTFFINLRKEFLNEIQYQQTDYLNFLLGILNSEVMEFYQKSISGSLYSKKYRYTTSNLNRWVIPKITEENRVLADRIIRIVEALNENHSNHTNYEDELNNIVYDLYNIDEDAKIQIKSFIKTNR